jgi:hypothetical protein
MYVAGGITPRGKSPCDSHGNDVWNHPLVAQGVGSPEMADAERVLESLANLIASLD